MNLKNVLFDLLRPFGITNNKPDGIQAVHKQIYAVIAKEYDLQPRSVESNIRTLSDIAWKNDPARCKNRHPSPICTRFEHHPAGVSAPLSRTEAPKPYNWFSTAKL